MESYQHYLGFTQITDADTYLTEIYIVAN